MGNGWRVGNSRETGTGGGTDSGMSNEQLEQLVGKRVELYDPRKTEPLEGVILYAPKEERCEHAVVYRRQGEYKYRLLPAHLLSLQEVADKNVKMNWEFVELEGRYEIGNRTFLLGLKTLFEKAGLPIS